jgi:hypothetical protein
MKTIRLLLALVLAGLTATPLQAAPKKKSVLNTLLSKAQLDNPVSYRPGEPKLNAFKDTAKPPRISISWLQT